MVPRGNLLWLLIQQSCKKQLVASRDAGRKNKKINVKKASKTITHLEGKAQTV